MEDSTGLALFCLIEYSVSNQVSKLVDLAFRLNLKVR